MFTHTSGRAVNKWADSLRRWDTVACLQKGKLWSPEQYRRLIACCFEIDSVGKTFYTENSGTWLAQATAPDATETFLELVQKGFIQKFGEPTMAEIDAWINLSMDPKNQTPSAYAMEVKTRGELMLQFGRINKSEIICKFLDTLPPELRKEMEHFELRHSLYTGKHELQVYADEADTLWQAISQKRMDKRRNAANPASNAGTPRKRQEDRPRKMDSRQHRPDSAPGSDRDVGKENSRPSPPRERRGAKNHARDTSPDDKGTRSKVNSRQSSPRRTSPAQAPKERWPGKGTRFEEKPDVIPSSKPLGLARAAAEAKASVAQYLQQQGEQGGDRHIATAGYYEGMSEEEPISYSDSDSDEEDSEGELAACAVRARLPRSFRTLPITIHPPVTLNSTQAQHTESAGEGTQQLAQQLQKLLPAMQQLYGLLPAVQQLLGQAAPAPAAPAPVAPAPAAPAAPAPAAPAHRYGTRFQVGVPVPVVNTPQALMSNAQWESVKGHTAKANRLPYFRPTKDPRQGFRVKVRGKPLNVQLPLIDSGANVCMISSKLVAEHQLKWTRGHTPVTSSVGQTSALGMLSEPIDLHLCEGTEHSMHLTAGGPGGLVTMVTEPNTAFDLLLGCSFFNKTAADLLLFQGEYAYRPYFISEGDAQTVATIPMQMGLNKLIPSAATTRHWPGSERSIGEALRVEHLISPKTERQLYACCNALWEAPAGEPEEWGWSDVASHLRGHHAWLAITGTTPTHRPLLGIGEVFHAHLHQYGEDQIIATLGTAPRILNELLEHQLQEMLHCTNEELQEHQQALMQLRPLILCWPHEATQQDKWVALCLNLLHALSYLRAKGMHIAPYDRWMHTLIDNIPALRQIFESPDVLKDPGLTQDQLHAAQSPLPLSDHWHGGELAPDKQVPLEKQLQLVRHHHAVTRLMRTEEDCFKHQDILSRWVWESCMLCMDQVEELFTRPIWRRSSQLYQLLEEHAMYLEGKCSMRAQAMKSLNLFTHHNSAEIKRDITGMFAVIEQDGTLDRPALRHFLAAALRAAWQQDAQEQQASDTQVSEDQESTFHTNVTVHTPKRPKGTTRTWAEFAHQMRIEDAWNAITGATLESHPTLGQGELLWRAVKARGEQAITRNLGMMPHTKTAHSFEMYMLLRQMLNMNENMDVIHNWLMQLREAVLEWPRAVPPAIRWQVFCYTLEQVFSHLRGIGIQMPPFDSMAKMLRDSPYLPTNCTTEMLPQNLKEAILTLPMFTLEQRRWTQLLGMQTAHSTPGVFHQEGGIFHSTRTHANVLLQMRMLRNHAETMCMLMHKEMADWTVLTHMENQVMERAALHLWSAVEKVRRELHMYVSNDKFPDPRRAILTRQANHICTIIKEGRTCLPKYDHMCMVRLLLQASLLAELTKPTNKRELSQATAQLGIKLKESVGWYSQVSNDPAESDDPHDKRSALNQFVSNSGKHVAENWGGEASTEPSTTVHSSSGMQEDTGSTSSAPSTPASSASTGSRTVHLPIPQPVPVKPLLEGKETPMLGIHRSSMGVTSDGMVYRPMLEEYEQGLFKSTEHPELTIAIEPAMQPWQQTIEGIKEHHHWLAIEGITKRDHPTLGMAVVLEDALHKLGVKAFAAIVQDNSMAQLDKHDICSRILHVHEKRTRTDALGMLVAEQQRLEELHHLVYDWPLSVPEEEQWEVFCYTMEYTLSVIRANGQNMFPVDSALSCLSQEHPIRKMELKQVPRALLQLMQDPTAEWKEALAGEWFLQPCLQRPQLFHQMGGLLSEEPVHQLWHLYMVRHHVAMLRLAFARELTLMWEAQDEKVETFLMFTSDHLWASITTLQGWLGELYSPVLKYTQEEQESKWLSMGRMHTSELMNRTVNPLAPAVRKYEPQGLYALLIDAFYSQVKLPSAALTPAMQLQMAALRNAAHKLYIQALHGSGPGSDQHNQISAASANDPKPNLQPYNKQITAHSLVWDPPHERMREWKIPTESVKPCMQLGSCTENPCTTQQADVIDIITSPQTTALDSESDTSDPHTPDCNHENLAANWGGEAKRLRGDSGSELDCDTTMLDAQTELQLGTPVVANMLHNTPPVHDTSNAQDGDVKVLPEIEASNPDPASDEEYPAQSEPREVVRISAISRTAGVAMGLAILGTLLHRTATTPYLLAVVVMIWLMYHRMQTAPMQVNRD